MVSTLISCMSAGIITREFNQAGGRHEKPLKWFVKTHCWFI